jgi:hypothetical protein
MFCENLEIHTSGSAYGNEKKYFFPFGYFSIKDGAKIRFWEDKAR